MTQKASTDQNSAQCSRCGKSLDYYSCPKCNGKGYIREFLLLKNACNFCNGSGKYFGCPDEQKHRFDDLINNLNRRNPSYTPRYLLRIPKQVNNETSDICPFCQGSGSKTERRTIHEREPDRTVTEPVTEYEPGKLGKPGRFVTKYRRIKIPGKLTSKTITEYVTCLHCGGSGKKG